MEIELDRSGSVAALTTLLADMAARPGVEGLLVLACDGNGFTAERLDPLLRAAARPVFGGTFPQIIHGREHLECGTLVVGLPVAPRLCIIENLSDPDTDIDAALTGLDSPGSTLFVFVDGFSRRIGATITALFENFGLLPNYIGGGAGSLSLVQKPCLITPRGLLQDAVVLAGTDLRSGIGVAHGWQVVSDALKVTASDRNTILTLNGRPAFDVYREHVEPLAGATLDAAGFFDIAKGFPFGIRRLDSEVVVRDPLMVGEKGALVCVGEVPEGAFVHVLRGAPENLLAAAAQTVRKAADAFDGEPPVRATRMFIDCISRVLYLGEDFGRELDAVDRGEPLFGALTLGEIANSGREFLEFYNKTSVMALIEG